jgi:hypothetical protein
VHVAVAEARVGVTRVGSEGDSLGSVDEYELAELGLARSLARTYERVRRP